MSTFKKTVFLSNKESNQKGMATLTLEKKNNGFFCTVKTYNFHNNYKDLVLGIKSENNIIKQNIMLNNDSYNFLINQNIDLQKNLGCVLLENQKGEFIPILWGSEKSEGYKNAIVSSLNESVKRLHTNKQVCEQKAPTNQRLETQSSLDIESITANPPKLPPEGLNSDDTQAVFSPIRGHDEIANLAKQMTISDIQHENEVAQVASMGSLFEDDENELNSQMDRELDEKVDLNPTGKEHKFYSMIAEQLEELFDKYPREENLENLVENSRWVKISDMDERHYVVGIIYISNDIKYICYGVPGSYNSETPRELKNYSQWLPTDTTNPYDNGYWVMYQDADTGENVIVN